MKRKPIKYLSRGFQAGASNSTPAENLICAVYVQALNDMRKYPAGSRFFESAAEFLLKDPYHALKNEAYEAVETEIWKRREERREMIEGDSNHE